MKTSASLRVWQLVISPAIAGAAPGLYFVLTNFLNGASFELALDPLVVWFVRDFILAILLAVPAAALVRWLGAGPLWYWLAASLTGIPMGWVLANPFMEWHPTIEQLERGFQVHTMFAYAALFGLGALAYGVVVQKHGQQEVQQHAA